MTGNAIRKSFGSQTTARIWSDIDNVILVYVGSAAEFALIEENHWLFYTGVLPSKPWDRFLSTLSYNRKVFETREDEVAQLAEAIREIHTHVELQRSDDEGNVKRISNEAFLAVGAMLIEYGILGREYLSRKKMTGDEKEAYYQDEKRFFELMRVEGLAPTYEAYAEELARNRERDLKPNAYTEQLMNSYRAELGPWKNWVLTQFMAYFVPELIRKRLGLRRNPLFAPLYALYPSLRGPRVSCWARRMLFQKRIREKLGEFQALPV